MGFHSCGCWRYWNRFDGGMACSIQKMVESRCVSPAALRPPTAHFCSEEDILFSFDTSCRGTVFNVDMVSEKWSQHNLARNKQLPIKITYLGWFLMPWFVVECRLKCSFISIQNLYTGTHDMTLWQQTLKKQRRRNRNQLSILLLFIDVRVRVNTSLHLVGWNTTRAHLFIYYIVSPDIVSI